MTTDELQPDLAYLKQHIEARRKSRHIYSGDEEIRLNLELTLYVAKSQEELRKSIEKAAKSQDRLALVGLIITVVGVVLAVFKIF